MIENKHNCKERATVSEDMKLNALIKIKGESSKSSNWIRCEQINNKSGKTTELSRIGLLELSVVKNPSPPF